MFDNESFEHPNFDTPEKLEAARNTLKKFNGKETNDIAASYVDLEKMSSKPFKLPESLDKLQDENVRNDFTSQAKKVLGIEDAINEDQLKEINWSKGLEPGAETNPSMIEMFGKYAVEKGLSKTHAQNTVEFLNQMQAKGMADFEKAANEAMKANAERSKSILESYFGVEGLKQHAELLRRAAKNQGGLSDAEYEEIADELKDEILSGKGVLTKMMMNFAAKLEKEGHNEPPGGNPPENKKSFGDDILEDNPKTAAAVGWTKK